MGERKCLTFSIGEYRFAVPINRVREILNVTDLLEIPGGREPLEGIVPYREGTLLPVFSLLGLLGGRRSEESDLIIVAGSEESPVGFRVGRIGSVLVVSEAEEENVPYEGDLRAPDGVITGVLKNTEGEHILLEFDRMFGF